MFLHRWIFVFLILSACQKSSQPALDVLFLAKTEKNPYHISLIQGVKLEAEKEKINLEVLAPSTEENFSFQEDILRKIAIAKNYDAVLLSPNHSEALLDELLALSESGIRFLVVDTPLNYSDPFRQQLEGDCGFVGTDNIQGGTLAAQFITRKIRGGNVVAIRGIISHRTSMDREKGFVNELKKYPDFKIIQFIDGMWDPKHALSRFTAFVQKHHPRIDAIFAYNDLMAVAVAQYFKGGKRPLIVGFDGTKEAQKKILKGTMDASVVQTPNLMGRIAVQKIRECILQKHSHKNSLTPVTLITADVTLKTISSFE